MAPAPSRSQSPRSTFLRLASSLRHAPALILLSASTLLLSSCGSFFSCEGKASCPCATGVTATTANPCGGSTGSTGGTGSSTVDYAYVANSTSANTTIDGYNLGAGTLATATSAPFALGYVPNAMVVTAANGFLYVASDPNLATGEIYGYSIGTGGTLAKLNSTNTPLIEENDAALAVSPDGQWLLTLPSAALIVNVYPTSASTGALSTLESSFPLTSAPTGTIAPLSIAVAPSGAYFATALGTGGANVFPFDTTNGGQTSGQSEVGINPGSNQNGVYALAFDVNNYLYCATTAGLQVFSVTSGATVTAVGTAFPLGAAPRSIAIASTTTDAVTTPNYVYVGNEVDSTISAYAIGTSGALTAISGSPFTGPTNINSLSVDSTGKYLIASGYNATTGIQLFTIGSTGALTAVTTSGTAGTGTSTTIPGAIAATH